MGKTKVYMPTTLKEWESLDFIPVKSRKKTKFKGFKIGTYKIKELGKYYNKYIAMTEGNKISNYEPPLLIVAIGDTVQDVLKEVKEEIMDQIKSIVG